MFIPHAQQLELFEIHKATKNFDDSLIIGRGYYGAVYKGQVSHVLAAIKRLNSNAKIGATQSWPDVKSLSILRHQNLVSLIGYVKDAKVKRRSWKLLFYTREKESETILVYEYVSNGTLQDHLHVRRTPFSWLQRLNICIGVARGLLYLHTNGVMHGDLRSSNILLTESWEPKVADYGLSKMGKRSVLVFDVPDGAFGIPALDESRVGVQRSLMARFQHSGLEDMIDPEVNDEISLNCLKGPFEIAKRCLHEHTYFRFAYVSSENMKKPAHYKS
ncbi:putative receptor-like protein kinase At5g39000 [Bidens hawaiensis]|uniref:putative receptor-like protein kinase At5g39000 n=1 Tax=Bidens hawaiensis TaxID=980011 RepID=UPI00404AB58B